jgi:uncharacterized protein (DUF305 family)
MYAMVDSFANFYNSINQAYMAGLMAAAIAEIKDLCKTIIASQQSEIQQMKAKLDQLSQ